MLDDKVTCHVCLGKKIPCTECGGTGSYDKYKYDCAFDDSPERNEIIEFKEELFAN